MIRANTTRSVSSNHDRPQQDRRCGRWMFWGMEDLFRGRPGVVCTRVGYTGGTNTEPTYRHHRGHAEAIEITYDPDQTDYRALLEFFFQIHDPTTKNRQGNDIGTSYRSAIFYLDDEQKQIALDTIA